LAWSNCSFNDKCIVGIAVDSIHKTFINLYLIKRKLFRI
jgi:hypothetical protein